MDRSANMRAVALRGYHLKFNRLFQLNMWQDCISRKRRVSPLMIFPPAAGYWHEEGTAFSVRAPGEIQCYNETG
jgi:hypothetical protein